MPMLKAIFKSLYGLKFFRLATVLVGKPRCGHQKAETPNTWSSADRKLSTRWLNNGSGVMFKSDSPARGLAKEFLD